MCHTNSRYFDCNSKQTCFKDEVLKKRTFLLKIIMDKHNITFLQKLVCKFKIATARSFCVALYVRFEKRI